MNLAMLYPRILFGYHIKMSRSYALQKLLSSIISRLFIFIFIFIILESGLKRSCCGLCQSWFFLESLFGGSSGEHSFSYTPKRRSVLLYLGWLSSSKACAACTWRLGEEGDTLQASQISWINMISGVRCCNQIALTHEPNRLTDFEKKCMVSQGKHGGRDS